MVGIDAMAPSATASVSPCATLDAERASADLHDEVVQRNVRIGELVAECAPAVDGEAVVGTLAGERDRARGYGLAQPQHAGVARRVVVAAGARLDLCVELAQTRDDRVICPGRHEHAQRAVRRACDDRGGQRGVAAARDGELARDRSIPTTSSQIATPMR